VIAFLRIEKEVLSELQEFKPRGGSTALCIFMHHDHVYCANLGDSRAILFKENKYQELTTLHDFTNENERIFAEKHGGTVLNNRLEGELAVSRSIGDINFKKYMNSEPEILSTKLTEDDEYLILGTDGFWNGLGPEACLKFMQKLNLKKSYTKDLKLLGDALIEEACKNVKTKKDNMTLIVISIKGYFEKHGFQSDMIK